MGSLLQSPQHHVITAFTFGTYVTVALLHASSHWPPASNYALGFPICLTIPEHFGCMTKLTAREVCSNLVCSNLLDPVPAILGAIRPAVDWGPPPQVINNPIRRQHPPACPEAPVTHAAWNMMTASMHYNSMPPAGVDTCSACIPFLNVCDLNCGAYLQQQLKQNTNETAPPNNWINVYERCGWAPGKWMASGGR
jgi:hypothetical protein